MPQLHALDDSLNWPINLNYDEEGNPIDWQFYIWKLSFSPKARYLASIMVSNLIMFSISIARHVLNYHPLRGRKMKPTIDICLH